MSIGKKLYFSFIGIIVLLIAICTNLFIQMDHITTQYTDVIEGDLQEVIYFKEIDNAVSLQGLNVRAFYINKQAVQQEKLAEQNDVIQERLNVLDETIVNTEAKQYIQTIRESQDKFLTLSAQVQQLVKANKEEQALQMMNEEIRPVNETMNEAISSVTKLQEQLKNDAITAADDQLKQVRTLMITVIIFIIVIAIALAVIITRSITRPLARIQHTADEIANGNLSVGDVVVKSKDELKDVAVSFNTMKNNLRNLVINVSESVGQTSAVAEELVASTDDLTQTSAHLSATSDKIAEGGRNASAQGVASAQLMEETTHSIMVISESSASLHENAIDTQSLATSGEQILQTTEQQMLVIQQSSNETNERIQKLAQQSAEISSISAAITAIADQTNLLSLNAAIEAARAGEHGKGFAVVADEVRKLAEQSKVSANQIDQIIQLIMLDTKNVEQAVFETVGNVDTGVEYVQQAQRTFTKIADAVSSMTQSISEMSASTEQITASTQEVAASVAHMSNAAVGAAEDSMIMTETTAHQLESVNEVSAVAKSLNEDALKLQAEINQFKI